MSFAVYVPWLHMHQPLVWFRVNEGEKLVSNLEKMLLSSDTRESWDAKLIARAYKNPAKYFKQLKEEGYNPRIILDFSGILLESLKEMEERGILDRIEVEGEKVGNVIEIYKEVLKFEGIEIAGSSYSHCYFPATPEEDWNLQVEEWKNTFERIFGKKYLNKVKGFWLPELGLPPFEDRVYKLLKVLESNDYEWLILPLQAVENYENLSYEERIRIACQPHLLKIKDISFKVVFRFPSYIIDQQAGCNAEEVYKRAFQTAKIFRKFSKKPALIVPASDGENGNVMMNEFFPQTFIPFFKEKIDEKISSLTISEFLDEFYKEGIQSEIKVKTLGASWINGHRLWLEGAKKLEIANKIADLSKRFHNLKEKVNEKSLEEVKRLLLVAETSCYVYWGTDFWYTQGEKTIRIVEEKLKNLQKIYMGNKV
ncbi:MAG: glycoside hydrolase [Candidatus Aenigmarchaeota archaeon]|nr:glycoside hydrolase [Candidatus Aenigmarchaeota archaeon]